MKLAKEISICIYVFSLTFLRITSGLDLTEQEIRAFKVPKQVSSMFPYYMAGYDLIDAPVWILHLGKWDIRAAAERGQTDLFAIWVYQLFLRFSDSNKRSADPTGFNVIIDLDEFSMKQVTHPLSNFVVEKMWNYGGTFLGKLQGKVEIYGTNTTVWKSNILKKIPKDELPEKLGGLPDFKPIEVYN